MFKTIACAVDGSADSDAALHTAADLARQLGASLVLFHVDTPSSELKHKARRLLKERWMAEAFELRGEPVEIAFSSGEVAPQIGTLARRHAVDLLVLGAGVKSRLSLALRSTAGKLIVDAPCPVLTVAASSAALDSAAADGALAVVDLASCL